MEDLNKQMSKSMNKTIKQPQGKKPQIIQRYWEKTYLKKQVID